MATLVLDPAGLTVQLGRWERFGTFQRSFTVPWDHIDAAYAIQDMWPHVLGWRWPGIGIPHVILVGRMVYRDGRDFCAIHRAQPGILLELHGEPYQRLLLSAPSKVVRQVIARVTGG